MKGCILIAAVTSGMTEVRKDARVSSAGAEAAQGNASSYTGGRKILGGIIPACMAPLKRFGDFMRDNAVPYGPGFYVIRASRLVEFSNALAKHRKALNDVLDSVEPKYQPEIDADKVRLGAFFNPNDYPSFPNFREKFKISFDIRPMPDKGELSKIVGDNVEFAEAQFDAAMASAKQMARENILYKLRLFADTAIKAFGRTEEGSRVTQTYLNNIDGFVSSIESQNICDDADLGQMIAHVKHQLAGNSAKIVNANPSVKNTLFNAAVALRQMVNAAEGFTPNIPEPVVEVKQEFDTNEPALPGIDDEPLPEAIFVPAEPIPEPEAPEVPIDETGISAPVSKEEVADMLPVPVQTPEPVPEPKPEPKVDEASDLDLSGLDKMLGEGYDSFFTAPAPAPVQQPAEKPPEPVRKFEPEKPIALVNVGDVHPEKPNLRAIVVIDGKVIVWG